MTPLRSSSGHEARGPCARGLAPCGPRREILVIEQDDLFRGTLTEALEASGYTVWPVRDGREALALARARRPDLILLDLAPLSADAVAFRRGLAADPAIAAIPVVAICGDEPGHDLWQASAVLLLPFGLEALLSAVGALAG